MPPLLSIQMIVKIWRFLAQILFYRNDLIEVVKPFFENLKNENMNDEKYIPFLKTISKDQLKVLFENKILLEEKYKFLLPNNFGVNEIKTEIEEIISGDKLKELKKLLQEKDIIRFNTIIKSFLEVKKMQIPLIQFCIMKNAIECFKYLLVNGFDDPNKTMDEQNPEYYFYDSHNNKIEIKRYEWDCMATAIYFGNKEIVKILEERGIEKGKNSGHIEGAILSYRNNFTRDIIENLNEREQIQNILNMGIIQSAKSNNIKGIEFLMTKGADINAHDKQLNSIQKIDHPFILQQSII